MTKVKYLFSTPLGDVLAPKDLLSQNIRASSYGAAPHLTLADFFKGMEGLILEHADQLLSEGCTPYPDPNSQLKEVSIIMEKCGAFYHVARIHFLTSDHIQSDLALIVAFDNKARSLLKRDHLILSHLWHDRTKKVVPRPISLSDVEISGHGNKLPVTVSIMEWLEDLFEWHFSLSQKDNALGIVVWIPGTGTVPLNSKDYEKRVFENISEILAYCFDPASLEQICLWNNAAGDFVIGWDNRGMLTTKLTTVRLYCPILPPVSVLSSEENLLLALVYLLLDLTLNIRTDRLDGTGAYFFAGPQYIEPTVLGFFKGLRLLMEEKAMSISYTEDLASVLNSLTVQDLMDLYETLLEFYQSWHRADEDFLKKRLRTHCKELSSVLERVHDLEDMAIQASDTLTSHTA